MQTLGMAAAPPPAAADASKPSSPSVSDDAAGVPPLQMLAPPGARQQQPLLGTAPITISDSREIGRPFESIDVQRGRMQQKMEERRSSSPRLSPEKLLWIRVTAADGLAPSHLLGSFEPFVVTQVFWKEVKVGVTNALIYSSNPRWEGASVNEFEVAVGGARAQHEDDSRSENVEETYDNGEGLRVVVLHTHKRGVGNFLGEAYVSHETIAALQSGERTTVQLPLQKSNSLANMSMRHVQGSITITLLMGGGA
jgi:hypothetical protein